MKSKRKKLPVAISLAMVFLFLTGCWDKQELTDLLIISGIGLDEPESGEGVKISVEFLEISSGKDDKINPIVFTAQADDIGDALTALASFAEGRESFDYCQAIIMGEAYAREGIEKILETVTSGGRLHNTVLLAVADGCQASEIFTTGGGEEPVAYEIAGTVTANFKTGLGIVRSDARGIRASVQKPGGGAVLTRLHIEESGDEKNVMADGAAVFKSDRLAGWLSREETAYFRMATGDASGGWFSAPEQESGEYLSASLRGIKLDRNLSDSNPPATELRITAQALPLRQYPLESVRKGFSNAIEQGVLRVFELGRDEFGFDIFGLAGAFEKKYGEDLAWTQGMPEDMAFSVAAEVRIDDEP